MPYMGNRFIDTEPVNFSPDGGSIAADGTSAVLDLGDRAILRLRLNVTANAATSLAVTMQGSQDNENWFTLGTFATVTTPAAESKIFPCARFVRASFNHTGSGAQTFTLTGEAV